MFSQTLGYDDDGRVSTVSAANFFSIREYDGNSSLVHYDERDGGSHKAEILEFDINGWIRESAQWADDQSSHTTFFDYTPLGLCGHQYTNYNGSDLTHDDLWNHYRTYGDATVLRFVYGTRTNEHGQTAHMMEKICDMTAAANAITGADRPPGVNLMGGTVFFETSMEGRILTAWQTRSIPTFNLISPVRIIMMVNNEYHDGEQYPLHMFAGSYYLN